MSDSPPLVSVVIPAYNAEGHLLRAIRSVLHQTESRVEVVVVDDASTDGTAEVAQGVADSRVRLLRNAANAGASASRNRAIEAARAPWVALLDADDWYRPDRLRRLLDAAAHHDADLVADDIYFVPEGAPVDVDAGTYRDAHGVTRRLDRLFRGTDLPVALTPETFVDGRLPGGNDPRLALVKPLMRRAFLLDHGLRYPTHVTQGEDYVFYLDCLGHGARFVLTGFPAYCYRVHDEQISRKDPLGAQQERLRVNAELLARPYVARSSRLRDLLEQRHCDLEWDVRLLRFEHRLSAAPGMRASCIALSRPRTFGHYLARRVRNAAGRLASRVRNAPSRLRQLLRRRVPSLGSESSNGHAASPTS